MLIEKVNGLIQIGVDSFVKVMFLNHQISYSHPFDTSQPRKPICTQLSFVQANDLSFDRSHGNPLCKGFLEHEEDRNDWHCS